MKNNRSKLVNILLLMFVMFFVGGIFSQFVNHVNPSVNITYNEFYNYLQDDGIKKLTVRTEAGSYGVSGELKEAKKLTDDEKLKSGLKVDSVTDFTATVPNTDTIVEDINTQIEKNNLEVSFEQYQTPVSIWNILSFLFMIGGIVLVFIFVRQMMKQQSKAMNFGNNKNKKIIKSGVKFEDVAGYEEEKQELVEIVDFLKNPLIYTEMGARVPKGVLLVGPPGTGKTLLAKAVAGQAGVNFIMQSGSEFVEMFVGVGASRARQLFVEAKKNSPCIIFIDEIDAIGRRRGNGVGGGNDEREQTLNQILIEMDGFLGNSGIVVMAATNRVDVLDPALLRPGRFDRQVQVNLPDLKEREAILKLHASKRKLSGNVSLKEVAKNTAGFSGAQLENVVNEAAIVAVREQKKEINKSDVSEAIDRVIMGPAKKTRKYTEEDKKLVAFHETGHVIVGLDLEDADVIQKVTIIPRGQAGGYASFAPKEDRFNYTKKHLEEKITGLLAGRAAEEIIFNEQTAGAHNDFERATKIARSMVVEYGMSDLGIYQYQHREDNQTGYVTQRYSDEIAYKIDQEINNILNNCFAKAKEIINRRHEDVELIANALINVETLERPDIDYLLENGVLPEAVEEEKYTDREIREVRRKEQKIKEELQKAQEEFNKEDKKSFKNSFKRNNEKDQD
ncbi:MAG: ATP-dependent zinc metalloprotease FtsH [Mycoplasmatales bacterium]